MLGALAQADGLAWASILVKAAAYAAALIAAGSALANAGLGALDAAGRRRLARIGAASAIAAAALGALRLPVQAAFLTGAPEGAVDPTILGLVADGPLGAAMAWRALGLALILALPGRGGAASSLAAAGAAR
ncbi:MAG: copper-binding protein, partial [Pseudomonadota bacterium]